MASRTERELLEFLGLVHPITQSNARHAGPLTGIDKELLEFLGLVHPITQSNGQYASPLEVEVLGNQHTSAYNPDNLRILMTTTFYADSTGIGIVAKELSEALRRRGQTVDVLHLAPSKSEAVLIRNDGTTGRFLGLEELLNSGEGYDVVHLHDYVFFDEGWKDRFNDIATRFQAPLVYTVHSSNIQSQKFFGVRAEDMKPYIDAQMRTVGKADKVVALTEEGRELNFPDYPYKNKFVVIQNGTSIPADSADVSSRAAELKQRYGIKDSDKVILYIGRIHEGVKGVIELAEALPMVKQDFPDVKLVFTGPFRVPEVETMMRDIFNKYAMKDSEDFVFTGELYGLDKDAIYDIATMKVLPSYGDWLPLVALESMARRRPILITKGENYTQTFMLDDPERRLALPIEEMRSPKAVSDAILYALRHPKDMQRIVERGYKAVQTYFNWDAAADKTLSLYRTILGLKEHRSAAQNGDDTENKNQIATQFSLEERLRVNPSDHTTRESQVALYNAELAALRTELLQPKHQYDQNRINQAREISEKRRLLDVMQDASYGPEVSVVIPTFVNKKHPEGIGYLLETVDSVLRQEFNKGYEIIIVDDGSELDIVTPLIERFGSEVRQVTDKESNVFYAGSATGKIKIIKQPNAGPLTARVTGYKEALRSGAEFISNFDSDDLMQGYRLQALCDYLQRNPTADMVHSRHVSIDSNGSLITQPNDYDRYYDEQRRWVIGIDANDPTNEGKSVRHDARALKELDNNNFIQSPSTMFRANVLYRVGFDNIPVQQRWGEDLALWKCMRPVANMDYLNIQTVFYRQHNGSMTSGSR